jgi:hypothetical protein
MANIYYQQFVKRFVDNHGVLDELTDPPSAVNDNAETMINQLVTVEVLNNDAFIAPVSLSIETHATNGVSFIPYASPNVIRYQPSEGFYGTDSVTYKIAYQAEPTLFATAKVYFTVIDNSTVDDLFVVGKINIYPNPADNQINISFSTMKNTNLDLTLADISGRIILQERYFTTLGVNKHQINLDGISDGIYLLNITENSNSFRYKVVVK